MHTACGKGQHLSLQFFSRFSYIISDQFDLDFFLSSIFSKITYSFFLYCPSPSLLPLTTSLSVYASVVYSTAILDSIQNTLIKMKNKTSRMRFVIVLRAVCLLLLLPSSPLLAAILSVPIRTPSSERWPSQSCWSH